MNTVALLHSDLDVGQRLAAVIAASPGFAVQGVARGFPGLRELFAQALPDLLLVDLMLPSAHVKALLNDLRHNGHADHPQVLVLAVSADDPRVMEALRHGADGYFAQGPSSVSLLAAIEQVLRGESAMTPQIAREVKSHFAAAARQPAVSADSAPKLSEADLRLLQWTAEGFLISEVARALQLSIHGVGLRIRHIYRRLQAEVRGAARPMPVA